MSLNEHYTKEIKKRYNYSATWAPDTPISLGAVGKMINYEFDRMTSLQNLNIPFKPISVETSGEVQKEYRYYSADHGSMDVKLSGAAPIPGINLLQADAGVGIRFERDKSIVFHLYGCSITRIDDIQSLLKELEARYKAGNWDKDNVVVTEVIYASRATILISEQSSSQWGVKVSGILGLQNFNLANLGADAVVVNNKGFGTEIFSRGGLIPLFKAHGLKRRFGDFFKLRFVPIVQIGDESKKILMESEIKVIDATRNGTNGSEIKVVDASTINESDIKVINPSEVEVVGFDDVDYEDFDPKQETSNSPKEGAAGTYGKKEDPLKEYDEKEPMSPAKITEHEPTAVKRDSNDQNRSDTRTRTRTETKTKTKGQIRRFE